MSGAFLYPRKVDLVTVVTDSPVYAHGFVVGRYLTAVTDGPTQATGY